MENKDVQEKEIEKISEILASSIQFKEPKNYNDNTQEAEKERKIKKEIALKKQYICEIDIPSTIESVAIVKDIEVLGIELKNFLRVRITRLEIGSGWKIIALFNNMIDMQKVCKTQV